MSDRYSLTTDDSVILRDGYVVALVDQRRPVEVARRLVVLLNSADDDSVDQDQPLVYGD